MTPRGLATALLRVCGCLMIGNALRRAAGVVPWILSQPGVGAWFEEHARGRLAAREAIPSLVQLAVGGFVVAFAARIAVRLLPSAAALPSRTDASLRRAVGVVAGGWALAEAAVLLLVGLVDRAAFGEDDPAAFLRRESLGALAMRAGVHVAFGAAALAGGTRISAFVHRWILAARPAATDG